MRKATYKLMSTIVYISLFTYSGPPCVYPIIQKEELMEEMLVKIQEKTSAIDQSL